MKITIFLLILLIIEPIGAAVVDADVTFISENMIEIDFSPFGDDFNGDPFLRGDGVLITLTLELVGNLLDVGEFIAYVIPPSMAGFAPINYYTNNGSFAISNIFLDISNIYFNETQKALFDWGSSGDGIDVVSASVSGVVTTVPAPAALILYLNALLLLWLKANKAISIER